MSSKLGLCHNPLRKLRDYDSLFVGENPKMRASVRSTSQSFYPSEGTSAEVKDWDARFNVTFSKDNKNHHFLTREYFGSPKRAPIESLYVTSVQKNNGKKYKKMPLNHWQKIYCKPKQPRLSNP